MGCSRAISAVVATSLIIGVLGGVLGAPEAAYADEAAGTKEYGHWRGWAIAGGGLALLASGAVWQAQSSDDFVQFDRDFAERCPLGCVLSQLPPEFNALLDRAETRKSLSMASYGLGAVATAAGVFLIYLDAGPKERLLPRTSRLIILGSGATTLAVGGLLQWRSSSNFDDFDQQFEERCGLRGCAAGSVPDLDDLLSTARLQRNIAFASYAVGGALVVTGVILTYRDRLDDRHALSIQPVLGPQLATINLQGVF